MNIHRLQGVKHQVQGLKDQVGVDMQCFQESLGKDICSMPALC